MSVFRVWSRVNGVYNGCAPVGFHFGSVGTLRAGVRRLRFPDFRSFCWCCAGRVVPVTGFSL